jgi:phosphoglycerol geranylgeranyltransferase
VYGKNKIDLCLTNNRETQKLFAFLYGVYNSKLLMKTTIYQQLVQKKQQKQKCFALLIDPDKVTHLLLDKLINLAVEARVNYLFVGGSLVVSNHLHDVVQHIKKHCSIPVVLFPGSPSQITKYADALLYLSLVSGRNPELLIGQHVISAPAVKQTGLEILSTGYMVIDGGAPTTVSYISNAAPIPADKNEIAMCTAMAAEMLGMKLIYMDAGSGAKQPITESMIETVSLSITAPLIVGGGITHPEKAYLNCKAGADVIVVGNAIEKDASLIKEMSDAVHSTAAYT